MSKSPPPNGSNDAPCAAEAPLAREVAEFERVLPQLLVEHPGEFALVQGGQLRGTFPTQGAALREGHSKFGYVPMLVRAIVVVPAPARAGAIAL